MFVQKFANVIYQRKCKAKLHKFAQFKSNPTKTPSSYWNLMITWCSLHPNNLISNFILIKDKTLLCHLRLRENSTRYLFHRSFLTFISFQFHKIVCNFSSNYHLSDNCVFSNLSTSTLCHAIDNKSTLQFHLL